MGVELISEEDGALLDHWRRLAWAIAADAYGERLADDLGVDVLQRLVDDAVCAPDDAWGLQSLGVRLGDLLCDLGFRWVVSVHGDKRNLAVAWKESGLVVNAPILIQKRLEDGEACDVAALFEWATGLAEAKENP